MDARLRRIAAEQRVFLRREAIELGYDDRTIAAMVRSREWHRVRRGAYTFGDLWEAANAVERHRILVRAAVRAAKTEVLASHTSSILEYGDIPVWDLDLSEAHLTRTDGRTGRREAGVRQHRGKVLKTDRDFRNGVACTSATRAVLEVITIADVERALVVANGALHAKRTTIEQLKKRSTHMTHWPDTLGASLVLRLADGRMTSVAETRTWYLLWRAGFPPPIPQYEVRDRSGVLIAVVDFAWPELGVFLEFDGKLKYTTLLRPGEEPGDVVMREKRREAAICAVTGWRCIRLVWADLHEPERTATRIREALNHAA